MKKTLNIIILFQLTLPASHAATPTAALTAQRGDSAYRAGAYQEAVEAYEAVMAEGLTSPEMLYNLGNAHYRLGQMGNAILNYERALRLRPSMSDARENLAIANSKTTDRIAVLPRLFVAEWYDSLTTRLLPSAWRAIAAVLFALAVASAAALMLARSLGQKKWSLAALVASALLLAVACIFLVATTHRYNSRSQAIVMQPSMVVKGSPEMQSVDKMILHEGTKMHIDEELSGWYKITIADGTTGWCQAEAVERI